MDAKRPQVTEVNRDPDRLHELNHNVSDLPSGGH